MSAPAVHDDAAPAPAPAPAAAAPPPLPPPPPPPPPPPGSTSTVPPSISRQQSAQQITLVDRTRPADAPDADEPESSQPGTPLSRKWTRQSLHQQLAHRKYARYREDRFAAAASDNEAALSGDELDGRRGRLAKGKGKVRGLLKAKKQFLRAQEEDAVIDILYENQRGWFFVGVPHFSSRSLLNFDPKPWLNAHKKPSPVNITNAQVPDPSWEWAWKSWYVDMSRDVDEEGWEYSFWFSEGTAWHGTHPWGHSWVRRRRWLRKRVRRQHPRLVAESHALAPDYFTIHTAKNRSPADSLAPSSLINLRLQRDEEFKEDPAEIKDIAVLLAHLRRAAVDREKMVLVRHFIDNAGDDLYYLSEQMPTIMSLCIFQNSRRQLLTLLMSAFDAASRHREEHTKHGEDESADERRRIDNLLRAISAADEQVKKLEYWSDIRRMVREGNTAAATDDGNGWPSDKWRGLDNSGPGDNFETTAKEDGMSKEELKKEAQEQVKPEANGHVESEREEDGDIDALPRVATHPDEYFGHGDEKETSDDARYATAEEEPKRDKGKMKVQV
ncbi:hypothetical protein MBLNU459_g0700t1 [Dothideomycetes sp. NU459]